MKTHQTRTGMFGAIAAGLFVAAMGVSSASAHDKMMGSADMMAKIDTNHDGKVSAAEHAAYAQSMFQKMDANHDGMVTKAEMDAGMKMMQGEHMKNDKMENDGAMKSDAATPTHR
jgi:Ca2+-binding EF-hand superfamily protein